MLNESIICSQLFILRHPTVIPCTQHVADIRVCGFMSSVCQTRWNATHFNIPSFPPRSILWSHFTHQSSDSILRDSDARTWSWSLVNLVDRNFRPGYQSTCRYVRQSTCLFQLGWFEHVVHSNQYLQRRDTPLSLGVVQVPRTQQSRKACWNDQTVSLLFPTHRQLDFRYESLSHLLILK